MKTIIMYQCEICKQTFPNSSLAFTCEAAHYHLSVEDYEKWLAYKKLAADAVRMECNTADDVTRQNSEVAIQKLLDFEKKHNLGDFMKLY